MKYCSNCGARLLDNANFCNECGARQQAAPENAAPQQGKKSLGEKMMDNYRTNRELQKKRWANFKWWYWVIIAVALAYFLNL